MKAANVLLGHHWHSVSSCLRCLLSCVDNSKQRVLGAPYHPGGRWFQVACCNTSALCYVSRALTGVRTRALTGVRSPELCISWGESLPLSEQSAQ